MSAAVPQIILYCHSAASYTHHTVAVPQVILYCRSAANPIRARTLLYYI